MRVMRWRLISSRAAASGRLIRGEALPWLGNAPLVADEQEGIAAAVSFFIVDLMPIDTSIVDERSSSQRGHHYP